MKATINFARYVPSDIVSLYVEWSVESFKTLSIGQHTERKPSVGRVFDAESSSEIISFLGTRSSVKLKYFIVNSPVCTAVPRAFFTESQMNNYLYVNQGLIEDTDIVGYTDFWQDEEVFWLYGIPDYVRQLMQQQRNTKCYHIVTALLYVLKKQSFFQRPYVIVSYIGRDGHLWLVALTENNKLYSANVYDIATNNDIIYYTLQLFNKIRKSFTHQVPQLVFLGAEEREVRNAHQFFRGHYPECLVTAFSLRNISRHYRISVEYLNTEDLFLLLLLSLCES